MASMTCLSGKEGGEGWWYGRWGRIVIRDDLGFNVERVSVLDAAIDPRGKAKIGAYHELCFSLSLWPSLL